MVFGDKAFIEVIKFEWGNKWGALSDSISVLIRKDTEELVFSLFLPPYTHSEERPWEDSVRRWPSTSQEYFH